jgi:hypothetical protein
VGIFWWREQDALRFEHNTNGIVKVILRFSVFRSTSVRLLTDFFTVVLLQALQVLLARHDEVCRAPLTRLQVAQRRLRVHVELVSELYGQDTNGIVKVILRFSVFRSTSVRLLTDFFTLHAMMKCAAPL